MLDPFIFVSVLSVFTLIVAVLYSKRIREAHEKYVEAKSIIGDVIFSFNRQVQRQEDQLEISARKVDVLSSHNELFTEKLAKQEKEVQALAKKVKSLSTLEKALTRIDVLEDKFVEVSSMRDTLLQKVDEMEKRRFHQIELETKIESAIPIKREKALAPLTTTELSVLEFLAIEGEKTAPEIKERIKLSREHTARLMKKLYEGGYLERSANKIPFKYHLKEEMRKILSRPEQKG
ncbi:MarR family transcriptional regulator [Candidatus Bathyarchaeota archaeon]|nr:MarR family transcriptional regulator [Candidatus Bathyarchaeota archaeon]